MCAYEGKQMWKRFHCRESEIQTDKISPKNGGNMPRSWITLQAELYVRCSFTVAFRHVSAMSGAPEAAPGTPSAGCYCMTGHATSTAFAHTFWQINIFYVLDFCFNPVSSSWWCHGVQLLAFSFLCASNLRLHQQASAGVRFWCALCAP